MLVADGEDAPRLSAVVERQRRELARVRAGRGATDAVAMARGVLMERHGWALAEAARQLTAMAAAAGLPEPEMAAAVLAQEPPPQPDLPQPGPDPEAPGSAAGAWPPPPRADGALAAPGEWTEAGKALGPTEDPVAI